MLHKPYSSFNSDGRFTGVSDSTVAPSGVSVPLDVVAPPVEQSQVLEPQTGQIAYTREVNEVNVCIIYGDVLELNQDSDYS